MMAAELSERLIPAPEQRGPRPALLKPKPRLFKGPVDGAGHSIAGTGTRPVDETEEDFSRLWISEGGSLYSFDGSCFVCEAVHSPEYKGWVGKIAVDQVRRIGSVGSGLQAFRSKATGALTNWVSITLIFEKDIVTKLFPSRVPSNILVYGHVERYFRV